MSLNKEQLEEDLSGLFDDTLADQGSEADSKELFVKRLAGIIDGYVKSAKVVYSGGLIAPSGGGAVTGTINHTIE
ncbi:hypothetical protein ACCC92_24250 [Mucilaginibacter sp. Mucisp84]|uniref:hypothetical protein n=1 Tax=Mucilaginibacter sp. Mucisp84 TaxID=3243058 RepID=UPI0039A7419A